MEPEEDKKKQLNDDIVAFMVKRSEHEVPRYTARLKTYVDIQKKRRRANAARRHSDKNQEKLGTSRNRKGDAEQEEKSPENVDGQTNDGDRVSRKKEKHNTNEKCPHRSRSLTPSISGAPSDACCRRRRRRRRSCCRRRRRRCSRRRRRRSCRRRRRRRCSRRRRRRRSCSRRRRRRSCRRRRRRRRRRR